MHPVEDLRADASVLNQGAHALWQAHLHHARIGNNERVLHPQALEIRGDLAGSSWPEFERGHLHREDGFIRNIKTTHPVCSFVEIKAHEYRFFGPFRKGSLSISKAMYEDNRLRADSLLNIVHREIFELNLCHTKPLSQKARTLTATLSLYLLTCSTSTSTARLPEAWIALPSPSVEGRM